MPKSLLYLAASLVDLSLALQVQPRADLVNLRVDEGRTTELVWAWSDSRTEFTYDSRGRVQGRQNCHKFCSEFCAGGECDKLAMLEIDSTNKMQDLEAEMGTSECTSYGNQNVLGPSVTADGVCEAFDPTYKMTDHCATYALPGMKFLCPCEISLGTCTIAEDPHIRVFDEAQISLLAVEGGARMDDKSIGEKWLVKSGRVKVQARFENMGNELHSKVYSRAIALGGEILKNNVMTVGSLEDLITWNGETILSDEQSSFYMREGSFFINATRGSSSLVQDPSQQNLGVNIRLQSGVSMIVNREHHYTNIAIRMPKQAGGQEGLCGNFNGLGTDDSLEMIIDRSNPAVAPEESLFAGISFN